MKLDRNNIQERIKDTLMVTLQMEFHETNDDKTLEATMPVQGFNCQTHRVLHGGATIALAETVAGVGSNILCLEDEACFGMQISANHVTTANIGDTVRAVGTIIHKGHTTHVWNVDVFSEEKGRLVSSVRVTNAVVKRRD